VSAFDDHVNNALDRVFDALRGHIDTALVACREELARAAADESNRLAAEAESARSETAQVAERHLTEWRETAARDAEERDRDIEARERQAEAREHDAEAREIEADTQRREAEARQQATERALEDVRRALEDMRRQSQEDVDAARQEADRLYVELSDASRLPEVIRILDAATSLGEALDGLVDAAAREAGRAAVFLVKGDRLHDWRTVGFGDVSSERIQIPVDEEGPLGEAVRGGRGVGRGEQLPAFATGAGPRYAVTMPVSVGGAVVAILYADGPDADKEIEPVWPDRLDVLTRYAGRMLESITIRQAAGLSAARVVRTGSASRASSPPGSVQ
jgi:hypothetical protein